ncbi:MAG: LPXTG cell wall anchor domain-containing protein [Streptococcus sp.]
MNKKENAADPTLNPLKPVTPSTITKDLETSKPVVSKVVTTPNGKVFFISTRSEALKETEKVTEASAQTEILPTTGDKGSHAGLLGLGMLLTLFGLSGKHKGKEKTKKFADKKELTIWLTLFCFSSCCYVFFDTGLVFGRNSV